jgi:hypothetical protein
MNKFSCFIAMKRMFCGLSVIVPLFCGSTSLWAGDPNTSTPKWLDDYYAACFLYNSGVTEISTDPKAAIATLQKAQEYDQLALGKGASTLGGQLSVIIGKAIWVAENTKSTPVVQQPAKQNNVVYAVSRKPVNARIK